MHGLARQWNAVLKRSFSAAAAANALDEAARRVAVVGGGLMGSGIAQVMATSRYAVSLVDVSDAALEKSRALIAKSLARAARRAVGDDAQAQDAFALDIMRRITFTTEPEQAVRGAGVVVEAVAEKLALKQDIFARIEHAAPDDAIFVSNTSSLPISQIFERLSPARIPRTAGLHFFNPAPQMKLVEIVRAAGTSEATMQELAAFAKSLNKVSVVCKDTPGFIVNRLLIPYMLEAIRMVERGEATKEDVDTAMKLGAGYPMGPFQLLDYVGLDTTKFIVNGWHEERPEMKGCDTFKTPESLEKLVESGKLGMKSGSGFYDYK